MAAEVPIKPFSTTGIGSMPHTDAGEAVGLVLESFDIPFWPQLPQRGFRELMIPQYSEGMPGIRADEARGDVFVQRDEEEIRRFYETCTPEAKIAISEDYAKGLHVFLEKVEGKKFDFLKGHVTGPLTFTLGLKDSGGRPVYFDEELREISLMLLAAKARWQVDVLGQSAGNVIIFMDEPILSALGSTSYMGVSNEEALRLLRDTSDAIRGAGGIPGIHCCGRADWPMVMDSGVDIMNFDAYEFAHTLGIYPSGVKAFLERGGIIAWGAVPTTQKINDVTTEDAKRLLKHEIAEISDKNVPFDLLFRNSILTPSCGTGSLTEHESLKVFQMLGELKEAMLHSE